MNARVPLALAGLAVGGYGAFRLFELGWANLVAASVWLVGGVLLLDGVLAPLTIAVCAVGAARLAGRGRGPAAAGLLVLGTVTVTAIPVLGRFGARPDNPTLLDRDYIVGWLVFAGLVLAAVVVATIRKRPAAEPHVVGEAAMPLERQ